MAGRVPQPGSVVSRCVAIVLIAIALVFSASSRLPAGPVDGGPLITELMAVNSRTLADEDGQFSDWVEIHNPGFAPIDLEGWYLTDDPDDLRRWRFPAVEIVAGGYLVVFASGKDRAQPESELHTSFRLSGSGEYLALVHPDGVSVAHEFAPAYPEQRGDVSYGIFDRIAETVLVPAATEATVHVPEGPGIGLEWTGEAFDDAAWAPARTAVGYDRTSPKDGPLYELVESFDALEIAELDGQNGWEGSTENARVAQDSARAENKVLGLTGSRTRAHGALHVVQGATASVFFRLWFSAGTDVNIGLSADDRPTSTRHFETQMRIAHENPDTPLAALEVRDRGDERIAGGVAPETWYGVWIVVDALADTYELFLEGGALAEPTRVSAEGGRTAFTFRNGTGSEDLLRFYVRAESGHAGTLLIDDIHVSEGVNLANPTTSYRALIDPEGDLETLLHGKNASVLVRIPFFLESVPRTDSLVLGLRYDDGFVAYLNGSEIARRNAPDPLGWDSAATAAHPNAEAVGFERIDVTGASGRLSVGLNVLAVHGLNVDAADDDLLIGAELVGIRELGRAEQFFTRPTPGGPNRSGSEGAVADPVFSVPNGFQDGPVEVAITTETEGAEIRYTTDASTPSETSGEVYTAPILVTSTTPLRAIALKDGFLPSQVRTRSYLFLPDIIARDNEPPGYPTTWRGDAGDQRADYEMDPEITEHPAYRDLLDDAFLAIPTVSIVTDIANLFDPRTGIYQNATQSGVAWERPASVELIYPDGRPGFQENAGLRIQGGASRNLTRSPKRSLRLLFKSAYGPSRLEFPWFDRGNPVESFDTIILRAGFNQSWIHHNTFLGDNRGRAQYIRDQWAKDTQRAMGHAAPHNTYAHVFLNGIYWGLYNPTERPDATFGEAYLGGDKDEYDAVNSKEPVDGDLGAWSQMFSMAGRGLEDAESYRAFQEILDIDPFIDYMILHTYGANLDWDSHNWYAIRRRAPGGRWQFISWDSEFLFIALTDNRLNLNEPQGPSNLLQRLRANDEFRLRFADRVHRHFFHGGLLTPAKVIERWEERAGEVFEALVAESARWGDYRRDVHRMGGPFELLERDVHWVRERARLLEEYFPQRSAVALDQYIDVGLYPSIAAPTFSQHGGRIDPGFRLSMEEVVAGAIYYTLDGTDPRLAGGDVAPGAGVAVVATPDAVVPSGAPVRVLVPTSGDLGLDWIAESFDDAGWLEGTTGVGFEERPREYVELIRTDVIESMLDKQASVYLRIPFTVEETRGFSFLILAMKYDDGFVAYLNGEEVASRNAPEAPQWDSTATGAHRDSEAVEFETIDITGSQGLLRRGRNVLAIHGLNRRRTDGDLLILPELRLSRSETAEIALHETTRVKARTHREGEWSALSEAVFVVDSGLRVTEIMYNPASAPGGSPYEPDEFEFIELQNVGRRALDLSGVRLAKGIEFDFSESAVTRLEPGGLVVVVENLEAFASRYDAASIPVAGEYAGRLSNQGEEIAVLGALDETMLEFRYDDGWHPRSDGDGPSLVIVDSRGVDLEAWGREESWRPSQLPLGSPGVDESPEPAGGLQLPGDADQNGSVNLADPISILRHLAGGGTGSLPCEGRTIADGANRDLLDVNGDAGVNLADAVYLLGYLFQRGPAPVDGTDCVRIAGCGDVCSP